MTDPQPNETDTMRIIHVTASLSPRAGGPATVAAHLAAAQAQMGHETSIISCVAEEERAALRAATAGIAGFDQVTLHLRPWATARSNWLGARMMRLFKNEIAGADAVHIHGVWEGMLLAACRAARRAGVPYIVRPCGMLDPWSLAQRGLKKRMALFVAHRKMLNNAAAIHALTSTEVDSVHKLGITAPSILIPNGVTIEPANESRANALFTRVPAIRGKRYVLFLGRLHHKKGLDILAESFARIAARHADVHLLVAGPDEGESGPFMRQVEAKGLSERVHMAGELTGDAKFGAFAHATAFCLPSRQEGFSNAVIEAMAAGVPVAISTTCNFPEVEAAGCGRVFSLSVDNTAQALNDLLSLSAEELQAMGANGRAYIQQHHTWEGIAQRVITAYARVRQRAIPRDLVHEPATETAGLAQEGHS